MLFQRKFPVIDIDKSQWNRKIVSPIRSPV